jgi:hypothetical protein
VRVRFMMRVMMRVPPVTVRVRVRGRGEGEGED